MEMRKKNLDLSVSRYNEYTGKFLKLYGGISTFEEVHLLALLEMNNNGNGEIVVILPGWNFEVDDEIIKKQKQLAKKYSVKKIK